MTKTLSNDLRKRLIEAVEGGMSARAAGRKLSVSASAATAWVRRWRETGCYEPLPRGGHRRSVLLKHTAYLQALASAHGDWSEAELAARLAAGKQVHVHPTTLGRFLRRLGFRYKKNAAGQRTRTR